VEWSLSSPSHTSRRHAKQEEAEGWEKYQDNQHRRVRWCKAWPVIAFTLQLVNDVVKAAGEENARNSQAGDPYS
jgi:hypothetical protein